MITLLIAVILFAVAAVCYYLAYSLPTGEIDDIFIQEAARRQEEWNRKHGR